MGRVVHFEIHCSDTDRAERFYRDVFAWAIQRYEGAPVDYRLITTGAAGEPGIDGALVERSGEAGGEAILAYVCTVQVDDLADIQRRVAAGGGQEVHPPDDVPGVGRLAYFRDPEGNLFGALQPVS